MLGVLIYASLTTAAFYLGSRAVVTRWLWQRYPRKFAQFMDCAACTGFWYGAIAAWILGDRIAFGIPGSFFNSVLVGLCSIVWTPILGGAMQRGFDSLGSAVEPEDEP